MLANILDCSSSRTMPVCFAFSFVNCIVHSLPFLLDLHLAQSFSDSFHTVNVWFSKLGLLSFVKFSFKNENPKEGGHFA